MVDGARRVTTELDDYGEENGLQVPHTIRAAAPEGEVVLTVLSLEHNVEIPAGTMALPQEIESMRGSN